MINICRITFCLVILTFLSVSLKSNSAAKILVAHSYSAQSVFYHLDAIVNRLANRGHNITAFAPLEFTKHKNIVQVLTEYSVNHRNDFTLPLSTYTILSKTSYNIVVMAKKFFMNKEFQKLLLSNSKFDLVISNDLPYSIALSVLEYRYQCLGVSVLNHGSASHISWMFGEPLNLANNPETKSPFSDHMTFLETLYNIYLVFITLFVVYWEMVPQNEQMLDSFSHSLPFLKNRIPLTEILQNKSLLIIPSDHHIDYNYASSNRFKFITGINLEENKSLPDSYENFIANSTDGVILVSWGSLIRGRHVDKCEEVLWSAFKHIKQKIIWKTRNNKLASLNSSNIIMSEWVPQNDILAHKNVILYFTHGGIRSLTEATYHGVPVIITPFYLDQFKNAKRMEISGAGFLLNHADYSVDSVLGAINEVIYNPKYKKEALKRYASIRDRIVAPTDEAVYWIEYVLKHGNVLKSAASSLPFYKLYLLNIFGFFIIVLFIIYTLVKFIYTNCKLILCKYFVKINNSYCLKTKKLK